MGKKESIKHHISRINYQKLNEYNLTILFSYLNPCNIEPGKLSVNWFLNVFVWTCFVILFAILHCWKRVTHKREYTYVLYVILCISFQYPLKCNKSWWFINSDSQSEAKIKQSKFCSSKYWLARYVSENRHYSTFFLTIRSFTE